MRKSSSTVRRLVFLTRKTGRVVRKAVKAVQSKGSRASRLSLRTSFSPFVEEIKQIQVLTPAKMSFFANQWVSLPFSLAGSLAAQVVKFHAFRNLLKDFPARRRLFNQIFSTRKIETPWIYSFVRKAGSKQAALDACTEVHTALHELAVQARTAQHRGKTVYRITRKGERIDFTPHLFGNAVSGPMGFAQMIRDKIEHLPD